MAEQMPQHAMGIEMGIRYSRLEAIIDDIIVSIVAMMVMLNHSYMMPYMLVVLMHNRHLPAEAGGQECGQHEQKRHATNEALCERVHRRVKLALALGETQLSATPPPIGHSIPDPHIAEHVHVIHAIQLDAAEV